MAELLLKVEGLQAWYGESHILHGVDFEIGRGELVTLLGRNGAGKTTTLRSIMGILGKRTGSIAFDGKETIGMSSDHIARLGIAYCPEERGTFVAVPGSRGWSRRWRRRTATMPTPPAPCPKHAAWRRRGWTWRSKASSSR